MVDLAHDVVHDRLSDYLDGALDDDQAARIAGHLRDCARCAKDLVSLRRTVDLLGDLPGQRAPESLRRRLLTIPDAERAARR